MLIKKFSFGNFYIDGRKYQSDLAVYEDEIINERWWRKEGHLLQLEDIESMLKKSTKTVLVGRGVSSRMIIATDLQELLFNKGIVLQALSTGDACKRYNELEHKGLLALFHLTC